MHVQTCMDECTCTILAVQGVPVVQFYVAQMDCLKLTCEHALRHHVDEETALYLLSLADHLSCTALQVPASSHNHKTHTAIAVNAWLSQNV